MIRLVPIAWTVLAGGAAVAWIGRLVAIYGAGSFWWEVSLAVPSVVVLQGLAPLALGRLMRRALPWPVALARVQGEEPLGPTYWRYLAYAGAWLLGTGAGHAWLGVGAGQALLMLGWGAASSALAARASGHALVRSDEAAMPAAPNEDRGSADRPLVLWTRLLGLNEVPVAEHMAAQVAFGDEVRLLEASRLEAMDVASRQEVEGAADLLLFGLKPDFPFDSALGWAGARVQQAVGKALNRLARLQRDRPSLFRQACIVLEPATILGRLPADFRAGLEESLARCPTTTTLVAIGLVEDASESTALAEALSRAARARCVRVALPADLPNEAEQAIMAAFPACARLVRRALASTSDSESVLLLLNAFEAYLHHHVLGLLLAAAPHLPGEPELPPEMEAVTGGKLVSLLQRTLRAPGTPAPLRAAWSARVRRRDQAGVVAAAATLDVGTGHLARWLTPLDLAQLVVGLRNRVAHGALSPESARGLPGPILATLLDVVGTVAAAGTVESATDGAATTTVRVGGQVAWTGPGRPMLIEHGASVFLLHAVRPDELVYVGYDQGEPLQPALFGVRRATASRPARPTERVEAVVPGLAPGPRPGQDRDALRRLCETGLSDEELEALGPVEGRTERARREALLRFFEARPPGARRTREILAQLRGLEDWAALRARVAAPDFLAEAMAQAPQAVLRAWGALESAGADPDGGRLLVRSYQGIVRQPGKHPQASRALAKLLRLTGHVSALAELQGATRLGSWSRIGREEVARVSAGLAERLSRVRATLVSGVPEDLIDDLERCFDEAMAAADLEAAAEAHLSRAHWLWLVRREDARKAADAGRAFLSCHALRGWLARSYRDEADRAAVEGRVADEILHLQKRVEILQQLGDQAGLAETLVRQMRCLWSGRRALGASDFPDAGKAVPGRVLDLPSMARPSRERLDALGFAAGMASGWNRRRLWRLQVAEARRLGLPEEELRGLQALEGG